MATNKPHNTEGPRPQQPGNGCHNGPPRVPNDVDFDAFVHGLIWRKARQLCHLDVYHMQDCDDVRQELLAHLWQRSRAFDPRKSHWFAYATTVVERYVANLLRDKKAKKRTGKLDSFCNPLEGDEDAETLEETITERHYDARRCSHSRSVAETAELASDLAAVLNSLPKEDQDITQRLKRDSISQVARDLGMATSTLNDRVRKLRLRFEKSRLQDYL